MRTARMGRRVVVVSLVGTAAWLAAGTGAARADDDDDVQWHQRSSSSTAQPIVTCVPQGQTAMGQPLVPGVVAVPAPSGGGQIICVPQQQYGLDQGRSSQGQLGQNQPMQEPDTTVTPPPTPPLEGREPVAGRDLTQRCDDRVIFFDTGSSTLDENAKEILRNSARCLGARRGGGGGSSNLTIVGAADPRGNADQNRRLGQRRAEAVRGFLAGEGLSASQIQTRSVGEDQPVCNDPSPDCLARNRRAAIQLGGSDSSSSPSGSGDSTGGGANRPEDQPSTGQP